MPLRPAHLHSTVASICLALALSGCVTGRGTQALTGIHPAGPVPVFVAPVGRTLARSPATLRPLPTLRAPAFLSLSNPGGLAGEVRFNAVNEAFFKNSQAPYRTLALGPAQAAIVTVGSLDETLFALNGQIITATTNASGTFSLAAARPTDTPCIAQAAFVGGHRLSAIVDPVATHVMIDEATSMVTEMARWQLFPGPRENEPDLTDISSTTLAALDTLTRTLLPNIPLALNDSADTPRLEALLTGSGHLLRNAYVEYFGARTTPDGQISTPAAANALSDAWKEVLGFRPLALTRVAGNGARGYDQSENRPAGEVSLGNPSDVQTDTQGNVFFTQFDQNLISLVPKETRSGPYLGSGAPTLTAGNIYAVVGFPDNERSPDDWEFNYQEGAPLTGGGSIYSPYRLSLEAVAGAMAQNHIYFSSPLTGRILLATGGEITRFGRSLAARRLYTIAGRGIYAGSPAPDAWEAQNAQPALAAGIWQPTGLARDTVGNLFIADAGGNGRAGRLLVVRESDGLIFHVPLESIEASDPIALTNVEDLKLHPTDGRLYFADTVNHCVRSLSCPTVQEIENFDANPIASRAVALEMGQPNTPGFIDTDVAQYPDIHDISKGIPMEAALLDGPRSLTFDGEGNLIVGDTGNGRVRLRKDGKIFTLAGGLDTRFITGDARLGYFPGIDGVHYSPLERNILVTDVRASVVRRIHTSRGTLE